MFCPYVVDYCVSTDWFLGKNSSVPEDTEEQSDTTENDISSLNNKDYILYHCCEELELLSREFSNDEGGDGSVAVGPETIIETEHPDYLMEKGLAQSALRAMPLPKPDWDNPLPEHTPGRLQKAFIDVFPSGDGDPYQQRPRSIMEPKSSWEPRYMEWVAKQPKAHTNVALNFWIHNRKMRISCRKNVQIALMRNNIDKADYPTKDKLMRDKEARENFESKILCMTGYVPDSDPY